MLLFVWQQTRPSHRKRADRSQVRRSNCCMWQSCQNLAVHLCTTSFVDIILFAHFPRSKLMLFHEFSIVHLRTRHRLSSYQARNRHSVRWYHLHTGSRRFSPLVTSYVNLYRWVMASCVNIEIPPGGIVSVVSRYEPSGLSTYFSKTRTVKPTASVLTINDRADDEQAAVSASVTLADETHWPLADETDLLLFLLVNRPLI